MSESKPRNTGIIPAIISSVLAVLGIFTFGIVFVPLAALLALISSIVALSNKNFGGFGLSILAWVLVAVGFITSPVLLAAVAGAIGISID